MTTPGTADRSQCVQENQAQSRRASPTPRRARAALPLAAAAVSGALVAVQQRVNGQLGVELTDALLAALVSFATGLSTIALVVLARPSARRALRTFRQVPWWCCLGGLGGAALVAVGAAATPQIGVALLTVSLVAGQTVGGLVVDRAGLAPGGTHLLTTPRLAGAGLGVAAAALGSLGHDAKNANPLLLTLVVLAGSLIAVQQALNGRVRRTTGDATVTTLLNFVVGATALVLLLGSAAHTTGLPVGSWPGLDRWYLYLGGPLGVVFVVVSATVVRRLGVLRLGLAVIAGQLAGALTVDLLLPATTRGVAVPTVLGAALTLAAVLVSGVNRSPGREFGTPVRHRPRTATRSLPPLLVSPRESSGGFFADSPTTAPATSSPATAALASPCSGARLLRTAPLPAQPTAAPLPTGRTT